MSDRTHIEVISFKIVYDMSYIMLAPTLAWNRTVFFLLKDISCYVVVAWRRSNGPILGFKTMVCPGLPVLAFIALI